MMWIKSLKYKGLRGFSYRMEFQRGPNVLIGLNGCGKTTTLEMIATLTGNDAATYIMAPVGRFPDLEYVEIVVKDGSREFRLEMKGFDLNAIAEFKAMLPKRTSFVLTTDLMDDRYVTDRQDPVECQRDLLAYLDRAGMGLAKQRVFQDGKYASLLVSDSGAQYYLIQVGMRRCMADTPALIEHPDRHLHFMLKQTIHEFYQEDHNHQLLISTHDPSTLNGASCYSEDKNGNREYQGVIDFGADDIKW